MAKELIINASLPETRIALMEDGTIQELLIERESERGIVGNIYKGRVTRVLPGMQAAFVDIGLEKAAFLYVDDIYVHPKVMGEETEMDDEANEMADSESSEETQDYNQQSVEQDQNQESYPEESYQEGSGESVAQENEQNDEQDEASNEFNESFNEEPAETGEVAETEEYSLEANSQESSEENSEENSEEEYSDEQTSEENEFSGANEGESSEEGAEEAEMQASDQASDEGSDLEGAQEEGSTESSFEGSMEASEEGAAPLEGLAQPQGQQRRGRGRFGRNRKRFRGRDQKNRFPKLDEQSAAGIVPESMESAIHDKGDVDSDRASMEGEHHPATGPGRGKKPRPEFREQRNRDRRIRSKHVRPRAQAQIADLLKEGQEVIVQVGKDPIATKGARLTCHVSLAGRHLVCMPTIDHVGVSRRIERDDERRRLRDFVEKNRPRKMGFIVRTASGGKDPESWIKQDIDYLSKTWRDIRNKADEVSSPALIYEDLNSVLRSIRDWVNEDIDKIIVDSRYHYNELIDFSRRFMPALEEKIDLYLGDIPVFDAYGISSELHRSLERKVWLKSGGYIVIDQAEALVAIDVNTGRFVGKKSLEDTILKTNLEAVEEIAYQLRLRNCGGIIICDFIDMENEANRMRVYRALDEALKKDRARPTIQKISDLGLVEMTRKRTRDTTIRTLCEPCTHCEGKGYSKTSRTVAYEILREIERMGTDREARKILVSAHEGVIDYLAIELREVVDTLEKRFNKQIYLQAILDYHTEQFEVVTDRSHAKKQGQDIARQLRVERDRSERKEKQKQRNHQRNESRSENRNEGRDDSQRDQSRDQPREPRRDFRGNKAPAMNQEEVSTPVQQEGFSEDQPLEQNEGAQIYQENETNELVHASETPNDYEDEDQLAYLRAQAAQDAAIASLANPAAGLPNYHRQGGRAGGAGGARNDRNQRNQNQGKRNGGRHQNQPRQGKGQNQNRDQRGGGGARPQQQPRPETRPSGRPFLANQAPAPQAPAVIMEAPEPPQVPDYEVLVKSNGEE